jgi:PilZ domain-containing protein
MTTPTRRPTRVSVRLQLEGRTESRVETMWGTVVNVSANGMLVELGFPLAPGTDLDFTFRLPGEDEPVVGWGQIVRRATPSRYGVRIDGLKDDAIARLRRFVARGEEKT